jgi:hypothetical protein
VVSAALDVTGANVRKHLTTSGPVKVYRVASLFQDKRPTVDKWSRSSHHWRRFDLREMLEEYVIQ